MAKKPTYKSTTTPPLATGLTQLHRRVQKVRRISEERAAAEERKRQRENRGQPRKEARPEYPVGVPIKAKIGDPRDKRRCVILNDHGRVLRFVPVPGNPPVWDSNPETAIQLYGPTLTRVLAERIGGIPKHYHEGVIYDINYYTGLPLPKPGFVEVV